MAIMLAELDRLDRPFDRGADPTHVTASAIVVGDRGVVLHRHRRLHRWLQPGGHIDPGETPAEAADPRVRRGDGAGGDPSVGRADPDPCGRAPRPPRDTSIWTCVTWCGLRTRTRRPAPERARTWHGSPGRVPTEIADDALVGALRVGAHG